MDFETQNKITTESNFHGCHKHAGVCFSISQQHFAKHCATVPCGFIWEGTPVKISGCAPRIPNLTAGKGHYLPLPCSIVFNLLALLDKPLQHGTLLIICTRSLKSSVNWTKVCHKKHPPKNSKALISSQSTLNSPYNRRRERLQALQA